MENELNEHNKKEYPPMHTAEHILNACMVKYFGCKRAISAHIEKKKSKCDYYLNTPPSSQDMEEIEKQVNEVIQKHIPVEIYSSSLPDIPNQIDLSKLPQLSTDKIRLVKIGEYDLCACIGAHVNNTAEIGTFKIISYDYDNNQLRIRFKLISA